MGAAYDNYKFTEANEPKELYPGPSREQIETAIATRQKEIEWNTRRLANLVLDEEDHQQTIDLIFDLRNEVESLQRCFNV